jgi:hypothetical protein
MIPTTIFLVYSALSDKLRPMITHTFVYDPRMLFLTIFDDSLALALEIRAACERRHSILFVPFVPLSESGGSLLRIEGKNAAPLP